MKLLLSIFLFIASVAATAQTTGQLFVKQKLLVLLSVADKDLPSLKLICKNESGLIHQEENDEVFNFTYQSPEHDYYINVSFHFNQLYCKKVKIEITPASTNDIEIGKFITKVLKDKFKTKNDAVINEKAHTTNYFVADAKFSGILTMYDESKKIILTLSAKQD